MEDTAVGESSLGGENRIVTGKLLSPRNQREFGEMGIEIRFQNPQFHEFLPLITDQQRNLGIHSDNDVEARSRVGSGIKSGVGDVPKDRNVGIVRGFEGFEALGGLNWMGNRVDFDSEGLTHLLGGPVEKNEEEVVVVVGG